MNRFFSANDNFTDNPANCELPGEISINTNSSVDRTDNASKEDTSSTRESSPVASVDRLNQKVFEIKNFDKNAQPNKIGERKRSRMTRRSSIGSVAEEINRQQKYVEQHCCSATNTFYIKFFALPICISLIYAIAILFPPEARAKAPALLWTDGALVGKGVNNAGEVRLCPYESICSDGILQIILIAMSRLSAFASYALMGQTFLTKMHCTIHALSTSYVGTIVPLAKLQTVHKNAGKWYAMLAVLHTATHTIRWIIRGDLRLLGTGVGISGVGGIICILLTIGSMTLAKKIKPLTFEMRLNAHWTFMILLNIALCFHSTRCRNIVLTFSALWLADYTYGYVFMTYRLDLVEFSPLPNGSGVQMLWSNPPGFNANSGEYVKVQLPWLLRGGSEWHPFSIYLNEATEEGLDEKRYSRNIDRPHFGGVGSRDVDPSKTALLLIECQNEFASKGGRLHDGVHHVMESTNMLEKTVELAACARAAGAHVFHLPVVLNANGSDNPNKTLGILKDCRDGRCFTKGTWNAEIIDCLKPQQDDLVIRNKKGLDGFLGTDLQEQLETRGVETLIIGGFLTNCCVESTMRTGYEKGYNVITLEDGTACNSHAEQDAAIMGTFKMFSTPMDCAEAADLLVGISPKRLLIDEKRINKSAASISDDEESNLSLGPNCGLPLRTFVHACLNSSIKKSKARRIMEEARQDIRSQYKTTQIFLTPAGDWTKQVYEEVTNQRQLRHCWVKGPFVSPYSVVSKFSNLVLVASGIGITPALGVMGQYKGNSRVKILIWSTRCPRMLKFFVPLFEEDATIAIIYYTGKEPLSDEELFGLSSSSNIFIHMARPESLTDTVSTVITEIECVTGGIDYPCTHHVSDIPLELRKQWCILYCGGSKKIRDMFSEYSNEMKVKYEYELFDW